MARPFSIARITLILLSLFFAVVMWGFVTLRFEYLETFSVPLVVQNVRPGFAIRSPLPQSILLRVHGSGWRLAMMKISKPLECALDLSSVNREITVSLERMLTKAIDLPSDIQVIDVFPDTLTITLDVMVQKKVPIVPKINANFRDGYIMVGSIEVQPDSVVLTGARSVLDTTTRWRTKDVVLPDLHTPVKIQAILADSTPIPIGLSQTSVAMQFDVQPFAEKTLTHIPIDVSAAPPTREIVLFPPSIDIVVRGGVTQLGSIHEEDVAAAVDYRSILLDTSGYIRPDITLPPGLILVTTRPDRIEYVIRKK